MKVDFVRVIEKLMATPNIQVSKITPPFEGIETFDYGLRRALDSQFDWQGFGRALLDQVPPKTIVFAQGIFELHFALFHLPDEPDTLLCIGPWAEGPQSEKTLRWCHTYLDEAANQVVREYYNTVRVINSDSLKASLVALCSLLFEDEEVNSEEWLEFMPLNFRPDLRYFDSPNFKKKLSAELIAERYAAENRTLDAVLRGDAQAALMAVEAFGRFKIEPRFHNPMRELKNLAVIFNTLLRKTIERASIHPYYLDQISTKYSLRIEALVTPEENRQLLHDMVREYCQYVQLYSLRQYSPLIQKVINYINLHLDSTLSLKGLASVCYISPSYLSNLFKQETGQTLTDYINTQRMERAAVLLRTTSATVASVAEEVGILDVNYFAKMFKNYTGRTPTRYRKEKREL